MTPQELNFAYKIRHALNESLDDLPPTTAQELARARAAALTRRRKGAPLHIRMPVAVPTPVSTAGIFHGRLSWLGRFGLLLPALALVAGLNAIYHVEQRQRIDDTAEIDAAVLSDELPLSAYLDRGFNAYLAKQRSE